MDIERLTQAMTSAVRSDMKDLTPRQLAILLNVNSEPATVRGLASALRIGKPAVTRATCTLVRHGFITKKTVEKDARDRVINVTDAGKDYINRYADLLAA